jgi:hypothetical protein
MSPAARKNLEDATRIPGDNRSVKQKVWDLLKDPFTEMWKIMTGAGPFGLIAIMWSIIYFLFKEPKLIFWSIAAWWVAKWTWLADHFWNAIEWTNWARDVYKDMYRDWKEWISEAIKWAWGIISKIPGKISWSIDELTDRISFWYDFSNIQITENWAPVDLVDSNFSILYNQVKNWDVVGLKTKDWKEVDDRVKKEIIAKINEYKTDWIAKFWEKKFEQEIKWKSMAQVIDLLTDKKAVSSNTQQDNAWTWAWAGAMTAKWGDWKESDKKFKEALQQEQIQAIPSHWVKQQTFWNPKKLTNTPYAPWAWTKSTLS